MSGFRWIGRVVVSPILQSLLHWAWKRKACNGVLRFSLFKVVAISVKHVRRQASTGKHLDYNNPKA
jgi:hypothetical protein